jgi:hypothetical protein
MARQDTTDPETITPRPGCNLCQNSNAVLALLFCVLEANKRLQYMSVHALQPICVVRPKLEAFPIVSYDRNFVRTTEKSFFVQVGNVLFKLHAPWPRSGPCA